MKKASIIFILMVLSLPVFASDWGVRGGHANIRKGPSVKEMLVYDLHRSQFAKITDIGGKGSWIKVRFGAYISQNDYKILRQKGAEIKRVGSEGAMVQVNISGWTRKENLREREEE
jgi:hypothetical protein